MCKFQKTKKNLHLWKQSTYNHAAQENWEISQNADFCFLFCKHLLGYSISFLTCTHHSAHDNSKH